MRSLQLEGRNNPSPRSGIEGNSWQSVEMEWNIDVMHGKNAPNGMCEKSSHILPATVPTG